jgi:glycosyltransferase involved in cell wall biosynthesis
MSVRVALVHDYLTQRGGAERVVVALHRLFPEAPVFTSVYDPDGTYSEFKSTDVRSTFLQRFHPRGNSVRALFPLYPLAFGHLDLRGYDVVLSSSSGWAHAIRVPDGIHICYCHNPARWLYQTDQYLGVGAPVPKWGRVPVRAGLALARRWDRRAARLPDHYVANSRVVAERIRRHYGRASAVVHPPLDIGRFVNVQPPRGRPYYLVVSRLLSYKRIDLAIAACRARGARLVVVGEGPARDVLRREAGAHVEFRSHVGDGELSSLFGGCTALIQPGEEDFGLVPLEANAAGRPVIALARGGALETVVDGMTGVLVPSPTVEAFGKALDRVEEVEWDARSLRAHARRFSEPRFHAELSSLLGRLLGQPGQTGPVPPGRTTTAATEEDEGD